MAIRDWFGGGKRATEDARTGDALERIVELSNPRLRYARRYRERLLPAVGARVVPQQGELARVQAELAINEANLTSVAAGSEGLEHQLEQLLTVLASPAEHLVVSPRRVRLDNMNIVVPEESATPAATLDLQIARVPIPGGEPELRTFVLVFVPRAEMLPRADLLGEAARMLH